MIQTLSIVSLLSVVFPSGAEAAVFRSSGTGIPVSNNAKGKEAGLLRMGVSTLELASDSGVGRRQQSVPLVQRQRGNFYVVDLSIGNPPQKVQLDIDTGSSDMWVNPTCETSTGSAICRTFGRYNASASSTSSATNMSMALWYGSGSVVGKYWHDTVRLGGATLSSTTFGIASSSQTMNIGLMGVGLGMGLGTDYPNLIDELALQKVTQSRAFSLDLRSLTSAEGSIIFGGIDAGKFYGTLRKIPMIPYWQAPDGYPRYWVNMNTLGFKQPGQANSTRFFSGTQPVFLDSGGTLSRLPLKLVRPIAAALGATPISSTGYYTVSCKLLTAAGSIQFGFGGTANPLIISVPYSDFIWQAGTNYCYLGLAATANGDNMYVLGDTFLRSAFVVYDLDNFNMHLAQTASCGSKLIAIGNGGDAVPSVTGCAAAVSSTSNSSTGRTTSSLTALPTSTIGPSTKSSTVSLSKSSSTSRSSSTRTSSGVLSRTSTTSVSSTRRSSSSTAKPSTSALKSTSISTSTL